MGQDFNGRTSQLYADYKINFEEFQLFQSVDIVRQLSEL